MDSWMPFPLLSVEEARAAGDAAGMPPRVSEANIMRFGLRHPGVARVLFDMIDVAVLNGALDARLREIAILRVGWRIGSVYEWSNHVGLARRSGLSDAEILAVRDADAAVLSSADLVVIAVVDAVLASTAVSSETLAAARELLGDGDELIELVAIPGFYRAIGTLLLTFSVPLEGHIRPWEPDGRAPTEPDSR
jgi:alkylhydroperoxidase family enzyme